MTASQRIWLQAKVKTASLQVLGKLFFKTSIFIWKPIFLENKQKFANLVNFAYHRLLIKLHLKEMGWKKMRRMIFKFVSDIFATSDQEFSKKKFCQESNLFKSIRLSFDEDRYQKWAKNLMRKMLLKIVKIRKSAFISTFEPWIFDNKSKARKSTSLKWI